MRQRTARGSATVPPSAAQESSRICTKGTASTICTTVRRRSRSCGRGSTRGDGQAHLLQARHPPSSPGVNGKYSAAAALGRRSRPELGRSTSRSRSPPPRALAVFCPRRALTSRCPTSRLCHEGCCQGDSQRKLLVSPPRCATVGRCSSLRCAVAFSQRA